MSDAELDRIRTAYQERDAAADTPYRWDNPGYVTYMQELERSLLRAFTDAGVALAGARVLDVGCGSGYFLHRLRDYGAGVPEDIRPRLFTPFCTTKPEGIGLGLVLARELVEAHGGHVGLTGTTPGSEFVLSLPLDVQQPA